MSGFKKMIDDLNESYKEVSNTCMMYLCTRAGVQYRKYTEIVRLVQDLTARGFILSTTKYSQKDKVGQYLVLRDTSGKFISGYEVWIDFHEYEVNEREITEMDIPLKEVH